MKKLVLIFSLMVPAWLYSCTGTKPPLPTPAEVIQEAHEAFPEVREIPIIPVPPQDYSVPTQPRKPHVTRNSDQNSARLHHRRPAVRSSVRPPVVAEEPEEPFVPKCLFWIIGEWGCEPQ